MHDDLEVIGMERVHHSFWIGEVGLVPGELAVARVPSRRRELGAQVDERVAGELFLAKRLRDAEDFFWTIERARRLLIAERPHRRHLGQPGDTRVLAHDRRRLRSSDHEYIER